MTDVITAHGGDAPLLSVKELKTAFKLADGGEFMAVNGVSFDVFDKRALAIVGESGSGKSVTMRSILGLLPKSASVRGGTVEYLGESLLGLPQRRLSSIRGRQVGMVFQNAMEALNPTIPVGKQLCEVLRWHHLASRAEAKERAIRSLGDVGIPNPERAFSMYPFQFSGGMRQRAMIAMAIIAQPRLLVADEPTTALDVTVQAQVLDLLADIKSRGTGVIMITHDLGVARFFCDDMVVMKGGQVVEQGPIREVLSHPKEDYTRSLMAATLEVGAGEARALSQSAAAASGRPPILEAVELNKTFVTPNGSVPAVRGVSLRIDKGTTLGLVGESGSGKSTVARIIMGLQNVDSGKVILDGTELHRHDSQSTERRRMQMVFQNPYGSLIPQFTAGANITEGMRIQGTSTKAERIERAAELLRLVGLSSKDAHRYPQQFSGGQQQRLAIARALATGPDIIVCDEPTSSLDVSIQAQILELLEEIQETLGVSYLLISHNLAVVEKMSDSVAVMRRGEIVEAGTSAEIFSNPRHDYTQQLLDAVLPVRERV